MYVFFVKYDKELNNYDLHGFMREFSNAYASLLYKRKNATVLFKFTFFVEIVHLIIFNHFLSPNSAIKIDFGFYIKRNNIKTNYKIEF